MARLPIVKVIITIYFTNGYKNLPNLFNALLYRLLHHENHSNSNKIKAQKKSRYYGILSSSICRYVIIPGR